MSETGDPPPPIIDTERLSIRLPAPEAAARVAAYFARNKARFDAWDPPHPPGFETEAYWRERLERNLSEWRAGVSARLFFFEKGRIADGPVAGHISLAPIERGPFQSARLGYAIDQSFEGRRLVIEAVRAVLDLSFGPLGLHRVEANYVPSNERSGHVLRRCGFDVVGYARDYLFVGGAWRDHVLTAILNPEAARPSATM
jgi:ribosomal-protein-alanine N-acetyltransferase